MPYTVQKQGDQFCVYKEAGGESLGCHGSRAEAQAQIAAIYANESKSLKAVGVPQIKQAIEVLHDALTAKMRQLEQGYNPREHNFQQFGASDHVAGPKDKAVVRAYQNVHHARMRVWDVRSGDARNNLVKLQYALGDIGGAKSWLQQASLPNLVTQADRIAAIMRPYNEMLRKKVSMGDYSAGQETPGVLHTERLTKMTKVKVMTKLHKPKVKTSLGTPPKLQSKPEAKIFGWGGKPKPAAPVDYSDKLDEARQKLVAGLEAEQKWIAKQVWNSAMQPALRLIEEAEAALPGITFVTIAAKFRAATALLDQIYRDNEAVLQRQKPMLRKKSLDAAMIAAVKSLHIAARKAKAHKSATKGPFPSRFPSAPDALGLGQREGGAAQRQKLKERLAWLVHHYIPGLQIEIEALDTIYHQHVNKLLAILTRAYQAADPAARQKYSPVFGKIREADDFAARMYRTNIQRLNAAQQERQEILNQF